MKDILHWSSFDEYARPETSPYFLGKTGSDIVTDTGGRVPKHMIEMTAPSQSRLFHQLSSSTFSPSSAYVGNPL